MSATTYIETQTLRKETCCNCHVLFAMPEALSLERRRDRQTFYCPNGHGQHYTGPTPESELRAKLVDAERNAASEKMMRGWAEDSRRDAEKRADKERMGRLGERSAKIRLQKRVGNGACPCCNRQFDNLRRHMATCHPEFKEGDGAGPREVPPATPAVRRGRPLGSKNKPKQGGMR